VGYPIFVARNVHAVLAALMPSAPSLVALTLAQLPVLVPYCWLRDLRYLGASSGCEPAPVLDARCWPSVSANHA
jgi:hypothetical protein